MKTKTLKSLLKYSIAIALAVVLIKFTLKDVDWKVFMESLTQTRWFWVIMTAVFAIASNIFRTERWRDMMITLDPKIKRVALWDSVNFGNLISLVIPWIGLFLRAGTVKGSKVGYDKTLGTITTERGLDILMEMILILSALILNSGDIAAFFVEKIAVPLSGKVSPAVWIIGVVLLMLAVGALLGVFRVRGRYSFADKIADWFEGLFEGLKSIKDVKSKRRFIAWSILTWLPYVFMCYCVTKAIPGLEHLNFNDAVFLSAVGSLASLVPVPGGFGAYHYLSALAISSIYGASWEMGILFATLNHETRVVVLLVTGIISLVNMNLGKEKDQPSQAGPDKSE